MCLFIFPGTKASSSGPVIRCKLSKLKSYGRLSGVVASFLFTMLPVPAVACPWLPTRGFGMG